MSRRRKAPATLDRHQASVQAQTAATWAKRAIEAYQRCASSSCREALVEAEGHRDEALEHAALVGDRGVTVARIQRRMDVARGRAWKATEP